MSDGENELRCSWQQTMSVVLGKQIVSLQEAKRLGLLRYFTGRPCKNGHYSERLISNRVCMQCKAPRDAERKRACPKLRKRAYEASRAWDKQNKDKLREYHRTYRKKHPIKEASYRRNRRARQRSAIGSHTGDQIADLLAKQHSKCANCFCGIAKGFHADHIMPLIRGGANDISNIQLLCPPCNCRKQAKDPMQWAFEQGRLL